MDNNLSGLSSVELKTLEANIRAELESRRTKDKEQARLDILTICERVGLPLDVIMAVPRGKSKLAERKVEPLYVNPDNPEETWTGRGRSPKWVVSFKEKHGEAAFAELRIKKAADHAN